MKTYRIIHIIANVAAFGVLVGYLIYAIVVWNSIPETIGVHFDTNVVEPVADFNIYGSKWFVLFPFAAGFFLLGLFSLGGHITNKVKLGLNVDERGEKLTRAAVNLYLDALKVGWGILKVSLFLIFLPVIVLSLIFGGMIAFALPIILIAGIAGTAVGA